MPLNSEACFVKMFVMTPLCLLLHKYILQQSLCILSQIQHCNCCRIFTAHFKFWFAPLNTNAILAFQHLLQTARIGYATEVALRLSISMQLYTHVVSALQNVWILTRPWKQHSIEACTLTGGASGFKRFCNVGGYEKNTQYNWNCYKHTAIRTSTTKTHQLDTRA